MATLSFEAIVVNLSDDLLWDDEFAWNPVEQSVARTLTGALIVESSQVQAGRPITLQPPDDDSAWTSYGDLKKLNQLGAMPGITMQLTFRGEVYSVMFRHQDQDAIVAQPVVFYRDPVDQDHYLVTVKLMEI